jgi:ribonuclease HII
MPFVIGTDEAGYGPNLGPLVISATVWRVELADPLAADWYERLAPTIARENGGEAGDCLIIADSKAVYHGTECLAGLERTVLAALESVGCQANTWQTLWAGLAPSSAVPDGDPWYAGYDCTVPLATECERVRSNAERLTVALGAAGLHLLQLRCRAIFPRDFNELIAVPGGKATVLSEATVQLVSEVLDELPHEPVFVVCDKHGGRNFYQPILQRQFPDPLVQVRLESRARSIYRWDRGGHEVQAHFCVGGEACLPIALASMTAKYLRETAMRAFNAFWLRKVPGLRPTAGYPTDARRFKTAISSLQRELGIEDAILWRAR